MSEEHSNHAHSGSLSSPLERNVRDTVFQLNSLCRSATLQFTLAVGELVVKNLYSGDLGRLRSRHRKDHIALRRVAADPDLAMSPSALYRSIAIFEVCQRIGLRRWNYVSTTHVRLVLSLPPGDQERLLREAEANRWPVRVLEKHVVAASPLPPSHARGGRRRRTRLQALIDCLRRATNNVQAIAASADGGASPDTAREAIAVLEHMRNACAALLSELEPCTRASGIVPAGTSGGDA
jgi:hypothetical protein